jgi:hypothetical protein
MQVKVNCFAPSSPHAIQKLVLEELDKGTRWLLIRAGRKWRKTSLIISWLFERALETNLTCPYIAPNRLQAKNICWDDHVQRILNEFTKQGLPFKKNESELSIKLPRGKVQLLGVDNQEALRGISNWGAVGMDEYDDWAEDIWPTIIRPNLITHKAPAIIAGTPKGYRNMYRLEQSGLFKCFHFTSMDNPDLDKAELEDLKAEYMKMGMGAYRQEILAEYEKPEGTVYEEWNMEKQYIPFDYDSTLPLHLSWDFGVNDPTAVLFIQPNGSELRLVDYYEASDANIKHFTDWIDEKIIYKKPVFESGDIAGRARSLITGKSVIAELRDLGHSIRSMPIPDIETQIRHAHRFIPNLYVSKTNPRCVRFLECILNYRYPKRAETLINQDNEAPIHDEFSHALKAFEYYCWNLTQGEVGRVVHPPAQPTMGKTAEFINGRQVSIDLNAWETPNQPTSESGVGGILH